MDDLLVGQVNALLTSPVAPDISAKIFQEFCHAQPGDAFYGMELKNLPIDRDLLASLVNLAKMTSDTGFCPRLAESGLWVRVIHLKHDRKRCALRIGSGRD